MALETASGRERWRAPLAAFSNSSPAVVEGTVFIGDTSGQMSAFDANSGDVRWQTRAGRSISLSSAGVMDGVVYVVAARVVVAMDATSGVTRWSFSIESNGDDVDASPTVTGGLVIVGGAEGIL